MPRASAAAAAETARSILTAATDLFAERGFAGVSLDDVATAADVTRGAVYHHYASKAGLFRSVAARLQADVAESVVSAAETQSDDPREQLRAGCHAFVDAITHGPAVRVLLVDAPAQFGWAEWRSLDAENSEVHLREALASVGVDPDILDALTAQLSGAMNEAALWIAQHPDAESRRSAHSALDLILDAVAH
ncbi:TetR/AcrR family transcriptional regulator [Paramicrobacterium agarici]|uniref:TetR/AcrR family transcriptional regulator n=1 Tax=Paramicrobacterium agarici TaxID=630514 RepID=UPI00114E0CDA|nr:TetR/AcrR family transcriptional regulator [Microbacterium agarici]TQO22850.1 TetR family transcriptional regulator [Microbacterium agarici]